MKEKVTIVIGTFNQNREKLKKTIEGFLSQDFRNFKIFIVDDNHPTSKSIIKDIQDYLASLNDSRINYIKNEVNIGVPDVFRKWINLIDTSYFMIYGEGDYLLDGALKKMVIFLDNHSSIPAVHGLEIDENGGEGESLFEETGLISSNIYLDSKFLNGNLGWSQASAMYRTEFFKIKNIKIIHDWYWDFYFHCSLLLFSDKIGYINEHLASRGFDGVDYAESLKKNYFRVHTERIYLALSFIEEHEFYMINRGLNVQNYKFNLAKRLLATAFRERNKLKISFALRNSIPLLFEPIFILFFRLLVFVPRLFVKNKF